MVVDGVRADVELCGHLRFGVSLDGQFRDPGLSDGWTYILTLLINMGVTILLATAVSIVGRSLAFGLSVAVGWFAADNLGVIIMVLGYRLTHNDFWLNITTYFLGPNLNVMASQVISPKRIGSIGIAPQASVNGTHTLLVALVYAIIFLAIAVVLLWRRDVKE